MRRRWLAVAIWDLFLVGVPLVIAAILAINAWPLANDRILLAVSSLLSCFSSSSPRAGMRQGRVPQT
jgi:hypothetical protein